MQFRVLGPLEVTDDGSVLLLGGASQRALLALLLLRANEVVSSDRLIEELWSGEPPGSGVAALQVRVSQLRKVLGRSAERLETKPPGYVLRVDPGELDLDRFTRLLDDAASAEATVAAETLRSALALWGGPALADLAYESFAQPAIARMEELRLTALERRIEADLALGRHAELVGELEELIVAHPFRERLRGQLMLALYRSGRQAEALEAYRETRRVLIEELGIEPGPALQELEQAMLRQDCALVLVPLPAPERAILVASRSLDRLDALLSLAEPLARRPPKEVILTQAVPGAGDLAGASAALQERRAGLLATRVSARAAAFVSSQPAEDLVRMALQQEVDLVLVDGPAEPLQDRLLRELLTRAPCDVAVLVGREVGSGPVLVPFVGAEHDWAAIELGAWAAGALGVSLRVAGPLRGPDGRDASRLLASASLAVQRTLGVAAEPLLLEPGRDALLRAIEATALVVVGLTERWQHEGLGVVRESLVSAAPCAVVLVRRGLRPGGLAPQAGLTRFTWTLQ